jgi:hypothetical protein
MDSNITNQGALFNGACITPPHIPSHPSLSGSLQFEGRRPRNHILWPPLPLSPDPFQGREGSAKAPRIRTATRCSGPRVAAFTRTPASSCRGDAGKRKTRKACRTQKACSDSESLLRLGRPAPTRKACFLWGGGQHITDMALLGEGCAAGTETQWPSTPLPGKECCHP